MVSNNSRFVRGTRVAAKEKDRLENLYETAVLEASKAIEDEATDPLYTSLAVQVKEIEAKLNVISKVKLLEKPLKQRLAVIKKCMDGLDVTKVNLNAPPESVELGTVNSTVDSEDRLADFS